MKYLLFKPFRWSIGYDLKEFASEAELAAHILKEGFDPTSIVAKRVSVELNLCEWKPAAERASEEKF